MFKQLPVVTTDKRFLLKRHIHKATLSFGLAIFRVMRGPSDHYNVDDGNKSANTHQQTCAHVMHHLCLEKPT